MSPSLNNEFQFFLKERARLVAKYRGLFVVIKDQAVQGAYKTELTAVQEAMKKFTAGTFLVQECSDSDASFTRTYRSRVAFA